MVMRMNDYVIERMSVGGALEFNAVDSRTEQAARFCSGKHGEQVIGADLAFEIRASRAA